MVKYDLRILVIDDDPLILNQIERFLRKIPYVEPVAFIQDGLQIINCVDKYKLDIIILDINMPTINGIDLAEYIHDNYPNIKIIFMSAFMDYAIKGYKFYPLDFLIKPINFLRLEQSLNKINEEELIKPLTEHVKIGIKVNNTLKLITINEILFIERVRRKTKIVLENGKLIETNESLTDLEKKLKRSFFYRSHQSFLIPLNKIEEILPDKYMNSYNLKVQNSNELIKVSKHKYRELKEMIDTYIRN